MENSLPVLVKQRVRIITMVWGENYLADFLGLSLPSLLAPGNLPALARDFDCEVVIVTEKSLFPVIEAHLTYRKIFAFCPARLVMCDDLVVSRKMYGHSLTHALHRGFEDLGTRMTDYYLAFFNADFILADGCYRTLAKRIKAGEELIFAPSYCVNAELIKPLIQSRVNPLTNALAIPPRELAELTLYQRHNTIRAKTVNQPYFHMDVSDQFYWYVDERTLIGHQLPIALVCMKPENVYLEPISFWDYATVSMACPTKSRCVIGDSDDFLMMELRGQDTALESMRIGRISKDEVAEVLGGYMTADQFEMGHYPLTLHCGELPDDIDQSRAKLKKHLDSIYERLPDLPVSHFGHPYWNGLIDQFKANQVQWRQQNEQVLDELAQEETDGSDGAMRQLNGSAAIGERIYANMFGSLPNVTMLHPRWADLQHVRSLLDNALSANIGRKIRVLLVESDREGRFLWKRVLQADIDCETVSAYSILHGGKKHHSKKFDVCFLDLSWVDMNNLVAIYAVVRDRMTPAGKLIAYHASGILRTLTDKSVRELLALTPSNGKVSVYFSGSRKIASLLDSYEAGLRKIASKKRGRGVLAATLMMKLAARSYRANHSAADRPAHEVPECATAITIEVEVI